MPCGLGNIFAGWAPQSFTSWWKNRAEVKQQSIFNFLDEDEKDFDTFGFTAAKYAGNKLVRNKSKGLSNACIHFFLSAAPHIDGLPENISGKVIVEKFAQDDKKVKSPSMHPRNRTVVPHQKMKGVENILGDIVIEAVIHGAIIVIATVLGQKEEGKIPPWKRVVAAENTQNVISTETGTLPEGPIKALRGNIQKPGKRNKTEGLNISFYFFHSHLHIENSGCISSWIQLPKFDCLFDVMGQWSCH
ncbi:uncharacterized protein LOC111313343 isoform X2 [Durio zibethinus]|uniref:Uncharacterized protein LOC111313343 isoform X2 n=1 Tax=Durio zibethinus TaxID=66656 RepID=A0A6P6AXU9_DURZI|nr:uncharacterized protein LOC111313343 isoform X2 [Durio zibethinus]